MRRSLFDILVLMSNDSRIAANTESDLQENTVLPFVGCKIDLLHSCFTATIH